MNAEVKELWIAALRSGEFEQGRGQLCWRLAEGTVYCCLGVLELLAERQGVIPVFDGSRAYLSPDVKAWAGLTETNPVVNGESLGWLNDQGNGFQEIARRIEKYL